MLPAYIPHADCARHEMGAHHPEWPELIYISAGFDAHREDDYESVTKQIMGAAQRHCQGRLISCLEGGYMLGPLARSVAAHVKVLIGAD